MLVLFFSLLVLIFFDARFLSQKYPERYRRVMQFPPPRWAIYASVFCLAMLPIYVLRRRRYWKEGAELDPRETTIADFFDVLLKWFLGIMLFVVAMKVIALARPDFRGSLMAVLMVSGFSSLWMIWLIAQLSRCPGRPNFKSLVAICNPQKNPLAVYGAAVVIGILFAVLSSYILQTREGTLSTPLGEALQGNPSSLAFGLFFLFGLGAAPLLEEFMFRGYFFGIIQSFRGTPPAIVIIAALFALMHVGQYWGDWVAILMVALLGLEITLLRAWSGSVIPGVVTHYSYNMLVSILPMIFLFMSNPAYVKYMTQYAQLNVKAKEELLLESIRVRPEFTESYNDLAWLYAENSVHLEDALKLAGQALNRQPDNPAYLDTKAEILYQLGKKGEAIVIERTIVQRFPRIEYYQQQLKKFSDEKIETPKAQGKGPRGRRSNHGNGANSP
jgi:membrane protease YdiL (CAAX protease family)